MRRDLTFRCCENCGHWHHPPLPLCPSCQSTNLAWVPANGAAFLYSWTRVHIAVHPSMAQAVPYYVAVIEFPECGGVRLLARLEHSRDEPPVIGGKCDLIWIRAEDQLVPAFRTCAE